MEEKQKNSGYSDAEIFELFKGIDHLHATWNSLSKEEALELAKKIIPILPFHTLEIGIGKSDDKKAWICGFYHIRTSYITETSSNHCLEATDLVEIAEIDTYHTSFHPTILRPTIYEVLCQIPKELRNEVVAFELYAENKENNDVSKFKNTDVYCSFFDKHILKCRLFSGTIPKEVTDSTEFIYW